MRWGEMQASGSGMVFQRGKGLNRESNKSGISDNGETIEKVLESGR